MNATRARVTRVTVEVTYSDEEKKIIEINPEDTEALFWSDRAVNEILANYYKGNHKKTSEEDKNEIGEIAGIDVDHITPEVVVALWNSSVNKDKDGDRPAILRKARTCIPTVPCKRC
ncbi:hypothetical protein GAY33_32930 [Azospirillum brasilense]|uniref:hypothetical protein n=1 Tax=Azospirillum argentinense TaxID=2970906 RepID=UPI00190EF639|nr:hypothetical protein [Azospirillum argentinense]MBK3803900.1 hypothetical protein [Azospirillum argentinense]